MDMSQIRAKKKIIRKKKNPADEKISLTKGQLGNIIIASQTLAVSKSANQQKKLKENGCCPAAKIFVRQVQSELRGKK